MTYEVLLFYKYVTIKDPEALKVKIAHRAQSLSLKGRVIIADEGINGTLEGPTTKTTIFKKELLQDPRFATMNIKTSPGTGDAFPKLSVKVRNEIVGTHLDKTKVDPRKQTGQHLEPATLRDWYEKKKDFVVIDMRNDYEFQSGHFKNAVNPKLKNSRDLPNALEQLAPFKNKTVLTVCTGGVRCEKMSAYLMSEGFTDVYQLNNGIHAYMEQYPGQDYLGTLYTFDQRVTMDFGGNREIIGRCHLCQATTESYTNCANPSCHLHFLACDSCKKETGTFCSTTCTQTPIKNDR